jgi:hypothetical protein
MSSSQVSVPAKQTAEDDSQSSPFPGAPFSILGESTQALRRVPDHIPAMVILIIVVEFGERFAYFGLSGPFQNYIK